MQKSGFREEFHPADKAILVWAPTMPELFNQAAVGMYHLMEVYPDVSKQYYLKTSFSAEDNESLLVLFLSELLYLVEQEQLVFIEIELHHEGYNLEANMSGYGIVNNYKEIKAVTFNQMNIRKKNSTYQVNIVFDV